MMSDNWEWPSTTSEKRKYLERLRLSPGQVTENRRALGKVVHVCHLKSGLDVVNRVTTCGSVGKKTASSHSADLDLVVYIDDFKPQDMKTRFPALLDVIQNAMDKQYPGTRDTKWYRKFCLRYNIAGMEIDILIGATKVLPLDFLEVDDTEQRAYMSASVSHLATRLMKRQGLPFHDMVRVAKHWRDSFSWAPQCKPKSYLLEVIMLEAFRSLNYCSKTTLNTMYHAPRGHGDAADAILRRFFELIGKVENYHKDQAYDKDHLPPLFICNSTYFERKDLPLETPEPIFQSSRHIGKGRNARIKTRKATAIVMDPVNPTNNLWLTLGDAKTLVERARSALSTA